MAMETLEVATAKVKLLYDDSMQTSEDGIEGENLDVEILADLDSYLQDINDRLTISRMVSDSVIKGMVTAVTQEASEKIAQKELELAELKEMLHVHRDGADSKETVSSLERQQGSKGTVSRIPSSFFETVTDHDRIKGTLRSLRSASKAQFAKLRKDLLGFRGTLHERSSERWSDADKPLNGLEITVEAVLKGAEEIVHLSGASLQEWKQEQEFQEGIEALVMRNCIRSLEQEFEGKLWDRVCSDKTINWSERMKEIANLREELNTISKSLCVPEAGQLISHGSWDNEGWTNGKMSHFHHNALSNHLENGKHEESQNNKLENSDPNYLGHLTRDELVAYYNNEITKLKRNHESKVQEMTEEYFSLKREYLKEKGSSLLLKKDKEIITLREKIPEVILKLDDILVETEKIPKLSNDTESLSSLKERLEILLAENRQLRDYLSDKKKEVKCLATQVSDAADRISQHSLSEAKLFNSIRYLKSSIEDLHIEASISSDVFGCLLREMAGQNRCSLENLHVEYNVMQHHYESVIKEASHSTQPTSKCGIKDSDMLSVIIQEFLEVIFREAWQEAKDKHDVLIMKYMAENEVRVSLEKEALEKERILETELSDKERLKQEIHFLNEEKERLSRDAAATLKSEKQRFRVAAEEFENFKIQQQILLSESTKESGDLKSELAAALEEVELYKSNLGKMNEKLEQVLEELMKVDEERRMLLAVTQELQKAVSSREANEREVGKQMESMIVLVQGVSEAATDFEYRVTNSILKNCSRLKNLNTQSSLLIQKANILKRTGVLYKQRLDKRVADLQKAEAEVDLLGDEVDTLLSLLEKIYLALDHYSPVLQHYPGIIDTLKLVKRELSGISTRSA